jgi:hypothetical protein
MNLLLVLDGEAKSRRPIGMILLKYVINKLGVRVWTGLIWLSISNSEGLFLKCPIHSQLTL